MRLNERSLYVLLLVMAVAPISHAKTIGNIACSPDNTAGEQVVCDYAIIGFKYQKLFDAQFANQRSPEAEAGVKKSIAACTDLPCVEAIIDQQMALPIAENLRASTSPSAAEPPKSKSMPDNAAVAVNPVQVDSKLNVGGGANIAAVVFFLFLVFLPFWIIFRKRKPSTKGDSSKGAGWSDLFIAFFAYLVNEAAKPATTTETEKPVTASINRVDINVTRYNKSPSDGFVWDGVILRPYNGSPSDGWELTGQIFKRYNQSPSDGFEWDGTYLTPYQRSRSDGYEWDGRILKPYGKSPSDGYELDGNYMMPYGKSRSDGWESAAPLPIPVWACVLGLVS